MMASVNRIGSNFQRARASALVLLVLCDSVCVSFTWVTTCHMPHVHVGTCTCRFMKKTFPKKIKKTTFLGSGHVAARGLYRRRVAESVSLWKFSTNFDKFSKFNFSGFRRPNRLKFFSLAPCVSPLYSQGIILPVSSIQVENFRAHPQCF